MERQGESRDSTEKTTERSCEHYVHRCQLLSPCCERWVGCRLCHDEDETCLQKLDRKKVNNLKCVICGTIQPVSGTCTGCGVSFGRYSCLICRHFDDDISKQQYHCEGCGLCRVGGKDNFFHCDTCGCCYSQSLRNEHRCIENNMHAKCPICFEYLFDSVKPLSVIRCGHILHEECLDGLQKHGSVKCPVCCKSMFEMDHHWKRLNAMVDASPENYSEFRFNVFCNDCLKTSSGVRLHAFGLRCEQEDCKSFNVRQA